MDGIVREPSSLRVSQPTAGRMAPIGTVAYAVSKVKQMELLVRDGAVGRTGVAAAFSLSLGAFRSPTSCRHMQAVSGTL